MACAGRRCGRSLVSQLPVHVRAGRPLSLILASPRPWRYPTAVLNFAGATDGRAAGDLLAISVTQRPQFWELQDHNAPSFNLQLPVAYIHH
jgi:hypothetical protein